MSISKRKEKSPRAAPATSPQSTSISEFRYLDVALLLDPLNAARLHFDEAKLCELIESIKEMGIIEPLLVEPEMGLFRVHAGHRRLVAARALHLEVVPCRVFAPGKCQGEALKHHENRFREDLNAAEEARHFATLLDSLCGRDVDKLCAMVHERRDYVEERLLLIGGDASVFQALADSTISIGVAKELNRVVDSSRRTMYLESAMQNGATVRMVRDWRVRGNKEDEMQGVIPRVELPTDFQRQMPTPALSLNCYLCGSSEDAHELEILYVHRSCAKAVQRMHERDSATAEEGKGMA